MSATLNHRHPSALPKNTMQIWKNDSHCHVVTTQSGKTTIDPPMPTEKDLRNYDDKINVDETPVSVFEKLIDVMHTGDKAKGKGKVEELILKTISRPLLLFSQRRKKNKMKVNI